MLWQLGRWLILLRVSAIRFGFTIRYSVLCGVLADILLSARGKW